MKQIEIIVATGNKGKIEEIRNMSKKLPITFKSLHDMWDVVPDIPETGTTFIDNALLKASWVYERKKTWTLADDSGLEIDFLLGEPGVYSSRYSGIQCNSNKNIMKVLNKLNGTTYEQRTARFCCVMVLKGPGIHDTIVTGVCDGTISFKKRGEGGFGYDSIFIPKGYDCTFAEMHQSIKNRISHRAAALMVMKEKMNEIFKHYGRENISIPL